MPSRNDVEGRCTIFEYFITFSATLPRHYLGGRHHAHGLLALPKHVAPRVEADEAECTHHRAGEPKAPKAPHPDT